MAEIVQYHDRSVYKDPSNGLSYKEATFRIPDLEHNIQQLQLGMLELQKDLNFDISESQEYDLNNLERYMVNAAGIIVDGPPIDFLQHEGQVTTICQTASEQTGNKVTYYETVVRGTTHDTGRRATLSGAHAIGGYELGHRIDLPDRFSHFAAMHHRAGIGPRGFSPLRQSIVDVFQHVPDNDRSQLINGIIHYEADNEPEVQSLRNLTQLIVEQMYEIHGVPGIIATVADWSKENPQIAEGVYSHTPVIAPFSREQAARLFDRQFAIYKKNNGQRGYAPGSDEHLLDVASTLTIEQMIGVMEQHGIDYHQAIYDAQEQWSDRKQIIDEYTAEAKERLEYQQPQLAYPPQKSYDFINTNRNNNRVSEVF